MITTRKRHISWAVLFAGLIPLVAWSQQDPAARFPAKPIRIIVPSTAGGSSDVVARMFGQKMAANWGQPVVIENKPGTNGILGTEYVARSAPDGYTLVLGPSGTMAINPAVFRNLSYATLRDFVPLSMIASFPLVMVVNSDLPVRTVQELVAYTKANPARSNYSSSTPSFRLTTELFKMRTGASMEYIAYKGSNDSINAVVAGQVTMTIGDPAPALGHLKSGRLRALAVSSGKREPALPDVPTLAEAGVTDMDVSLWNALWAPAGTPTGVVKILQDELIRIVRLPDIAERLEKGMALTPVGSTAEELGRIVAAEIIRWTAVAKANNISLEP